MLNHDGHQNKLCACALGIAVGISKALFLMLLAWAGWKWGAGTPFVQTLGSFLHGYAPTLAGGFIGGAWGLGIGFFAGLVIGWVYNVCLCSSSIFCGAKKCYKSSVKKEK